MLQEPRKPSDLKALREWMKKHHWTQGQMAKALQMSQGHLSTIFKGRRRMTIEHGIRAAVVTGLPVEKLGVSADDLQILKLYVIRNNRTA